MKALGRSNAMKVLACSLLLAGRVHAQQYVFHAYQQAEGLRNLSVKTMATDRSGFLWMGTEGGVYRFLGSKFQQYAPEQGIAERNIEDVFSDPGGTIWVGTSENLYRWDGQLFLPAGREPIHIRNSHNIAAEDARHLLVVDHHELYRLEHDESGRMVSFLPVFSAKALAKYSDLSYISSITVVGSEAKGQTAWMGCGGHLCSAVAGQIADGQRAGKMAERDGAASVWGVDQGVPEEYWLSVVEDREGTLWAMGQQHVIALPAGASHFEDRKFPELDPDSVYRQIAMAEDRLGRIVVATGEGLARWEGSKWRRIGQANGLRHSHIAAMAFDEVGDLWLGSAGLGLNHWIGYESWEAWNDPNGLPSPSIWSIQPDGPDRMMVGTEKGPAWLDVQNASVGPLFSGRRWRYGQVSSIGRDRDGGLWAGTFSGAVLRISQTTGRTREIGKLPALIAGAVQDPDGRVLFMTFDGVFEREDKALDAAPKRVSELDALLGRPIDAEAGCVAPDGAVWILANNRLLREKGGLWSAPPIDSSEQFPKPPRTLVVIACAPDGTLWAAGLESGVWRLTPVGGQGQRIQRTQRIEASRLSLPAELVMHSPLAIVADRRGWVWLGTDEGLLVWNGRAWRHLTQESGLIWNDVNQDVLTEGPDGSIWVGTSGGLARLVHPERVFDPVPLKVSITEIRRGSFKYPVGEKIWFPWASLPLGMQISSPALRNRSELTFAYRMEGLQPGWIETQDGAAIFSALPPGKYTFAAKVRNSGLNASSEVLTVQVLILPPWWRNRWMLAVYGLLFLVLIAFADSLRARHLRRRSSQLEHLISQRTSELEASREQLRIQATHDGLTGLLNRVAVLRGLSMEIERSQREGGMLAVVLADLDHFKHVNDTHGHLAGDEALRRFAAALSSAVRPYDHVGRYGGEEFLVILTDFPEEPVEQRLTSLHANVSGLAIGGPESGFAFTVNCSLGAAIFDSSFEVEGPESMLAVADLALYDAKAAGRNRVVWKRLGVAGGDFSSSHSNMADVIQEGIGLAEA